MARVATPAAVEIGGLVISEGGHRDQSEARLRRQTLPGASTGRNSGRGPDWRLRRSMSCGIAYSHARHFFTALINYANNAALIGASVLGELHRNDNGVRPSFGERWKCLPARVINPKAIAFNGKEVLRHLRYGRNLPDTDFYHLIKKDDRSHRGSEEFGSIFRLCATQLRPNCHRYRSSPARPAATRGRCHPFTAELVTEGVGVRGIGKAVAHIVMLVVVPPAAATVFDAAFAMEGEYVV